MHVAVHRNYAGIYGAGRLEDALVGMLVFSAVFATPFFILAIVPWLLHSLPRSGSWLNSVKVVMAFSRSRRMKFLSNVDLVWGQASMRAAR